jgi:Lrp/AsnC family leucine-responsive transcriptional regulator
MELDETDKKLLVFLQEDCKQTTKELSGKLGLSVTAIYERIKSLKMQVLFQNMLLCWTEIR